MSPNEAFFYFSKPLAVFDTITWNDVGTISFENHDQLDTLADNELTCLQWTHDDKWLAIGGSNGTVFLLESETWKLAYAIKNARIESLGMSPKHK